MQHLLGRLLRFLLRALVLGEVGYVIAANAFLNFGGVQRALQETDELQATVGRGWTIWPGRIHVEDVRVLFHDHNLEWSLDAKTLDIEVAFLPFLAKTIHLTRVRGEGLVFRTRQRVVPEDADLPTTRALPPIPEFETPALYYPHVPSPVRTDLWRMHVEDVDVGVAELWAEQLRYLGRGRARGAFRLHAGYHLWVGPASLDLDPGELQVGLRALSPRFGGRVEVIVHPFFVHDPVGREVLRHFSATIALHGEDVRLEPMRLFLPPGTTLGSPGARLDAALTADHGVIGRDSLVELRGPSLAFGQGGYAFQSGPFELVARGTADGTGEARLRVELGSGSRAGHPRTRLALAAGNVGFTSTSLDTSLSWGLSRTDVALSGLEIPELSGFDELAKPYGVGLDGGSASLDAHGSYSEKAVSGEARAVVSNARGHGTAYGWELDGSAHLSLGRLETELSDGSLEVTLLGRAALDLSSTRLEAGDVRVAARAHLSQETGGGNIRVTAGQLSVRQGLLHVKSRVEADVELSGMNPRRGTVHASATGELSGVRVSHGPALRGRAGPVRLTSELSLEDATLSGSWLEAAIPALSIRAGDTAVSANAHVRLEAKELDIAGKRGSASAVLSLRDVSTVDATHGSRCQWARAPYAVVRTAVVFSPETGARVEASAALTSARARWDDFEVSGSVRARLRYLERTSGVLAVAVDATDLRLKSGTGPLDGWEAIAPEALVASTLSVNSGGLSGPVRIRVKLVEGRIGATPVSAEVSSEWTLSSLDLKRSEAIGSGNLRIDQARIGAGEARIDEWWGRVEIPKVRWTAEESIAAVGDFRAKFRNGLPALAMFAASGDLPGWVPKVLPLNELEAQGQFRRSGCVTDIIFAEASGGPLVAAGRIQSVPTDTRGAFLFEVRSPLRLSAGLYTLGGEVGVSVLAGNSWLREQFSILDGWAKRPSCRPKPPDGC